MMVLQNSKPETYLPLSPLRYPGSKRRLIGYIKQALEINGLKPTLYIEPFVGGASMALQLMQDGLIEKAILMDLDPWVASLWQTVFFDSEWLVETLQDIEVTLDRWKEFKTRSPKSTRDQALTCLFLNRTSFSGIFRDEVGPLGGKKQTSKYKIDCRFPRQTIIQRIQNAAGLRDLVHGVWPCSWDEGIARIRNEQQAGSLPASGLFFYLDPPFFQEAESLYRYYFQEEDHVHLRDCLLELKDKWVLSYDSVDDVERLYGSAIQQRTNGTHRHHVELTYSLAIMSRKRSKEVIISNLDKLPAQGD